MLKILCERGEIAPEEQFLLLSTIFCYLMLDLYVKRGIRFSLRDKRLFEITEVEITRVDCTLFSRLFIRCTVQTISICLHYKFFTGKTKGSLLNPLYFGGLFHCYMLDESICHFRLLRILGRFNSILMESSVNKQCTP